MAEFDNLFALIREEEEEEKDLETPSKTLARETLEEAETDVDRILSQIRDDVDTTPSPMEEPIVSPTPDAEGEEEFGALFDMVREGTVEDISEISRARKIAYGGAQEPWIIGSGARLARAGVEAAFSDETFSEASQRIENARQERIFKKYPEFRGLKEDASVLTGRLGTAFADPLPWLIPWTKVAQLGRTATIGTGASVARGDVALREKALYGEVNAGSLLLAGALGGGATGISDLIARRFRMPKDKADDIKLTKKEQDAVEDIVTPTLSKEDIAKKVMAIKDTPNNGALVAELNYVIATYGEAVAIRKKMRGYTYKTAQRKEKEIGKQLEKLKKTPAQFGMKQKKGWLERYKKGVARKEASITRVEARLNRQIEKVKSPLIDLDSIYSRVGITPTKTFDRLTREEKFKQLKLLARNARKARSQQYDLFKTQVNNHAEVSILAPLEELQKKGTLTDRIFRKIMYEGTRPLFGGMVGWGLGTAFGEEDDEALIWSLTGAGVALGHLQKRIQRSEFSLNQKRIAGEIINKQARRNVLTWLKINSAASTAARSSAWGEPLDTMSKQLVGQRGAALKGKAVLSVEERTDLLIQEKSRMIFEEVTLNVDDELAEAAGLLTNRFITEEEVLTTLGTEKAYKVFQVRDNIQSFTDYMGKYVDDVGIPWERLKDDDIYGLTQVWNLDKMHRNHADFSTRLHKAIAKQEGLDEIENATEIANIAEDFTATLGGMKVETVFDRGGKNVIIPLLKNFEKSRYLTNQDARFIMQDYLINDPRLTLQRLVENTVPSVEFARTYGPRGELLSSLRKAIYDKYKTYDPSGVTTSKVMQKELDQMNDNIDALFGMYQANQRFSDVGQSTMAGMTALANSTMLTRVVIPSLGDLIQPFQNSGVYATVRAYGNAFRKQGGFADKGLGIKYKSQMDHEIRALGFGVDPSNMAQHFINKFNRNFFKIVQLERLTNYARAKAYDAGVIRSHDIAKKFAKTGTISKSLRNEINALDLDENSLRQIAKFDTPNAAYEDDIARVFLHKAGFKSAERDAIIPTMGNRLHFAQSNNPAIRAIGQFISWAQAKTTQTNALLTRVEDGDLKQAIRILGALTIYGGVRELQIAFSPSSYYDDEENVPERFSKGWIGDSIVLSGNVPVQIDKLFNSFAGPGAVSPVTSIVPVLALMEDLAKTPPKVINNAWNDDYWGATSNVADVLPFGKDVKNVLRKLGIVDISDEPNRATQDPWVRAAKATGGTISEDYPVTDVAKNPADRDLDNLPLSFNEVASNEQINPFTGEPYTALYSGRKQYNEGGSDRKKVLTYNQQYHEDTIKQGKVMINEHGQPVTANVIGVKHKGKIYNVPSYNRRGGFYTQEQAREVFKQDIEQGKIKGYLSEENKYSKEKGNIHLHPANIAAAEEHRMMDDATIPQESIAFNMQEDLQALHAHGRTNDMERLGFAKAGNVEEGSDRKKELNIVKEVLDKLDKDLDQDIKDNPKNYENKTNIKNKNPLNIIKTSIKWNNKLSDEESTDTTFEQFRTIFDGTRAGVLNVHAKFINTQPALGGRRATSISDMVDVLSPAVGDLPKYAHMELENPNNPNFKNYIAHRMGVGINDQLNFEDPKIMKAFVKAKTGFEGDNYELDDDLLTYSVQDAFKYKKDKGQYGQFNKVDLTNPPPPL